ncbi:MAG: GNAT family N-acetyltransferase [Rhizobiaceae bacterium]
MAGIAKFRIEAAIPADWTRISSLQEACFPNDPTEVSKGEFGALLAEQGGRVIVARSGLRPVGYVVMRRREFTPWESLAFVAVERDCRSMGVGKLLTIAATELSPKLFTRLHVRPSNETALAVYRRLGFHVTGRKINNYPDGEDALVMMRWNGLPMWRIMAPVAHNPAIMLANPVER